jgi:hypothetical protein
MIAAIYVRALTGRRVLLALLCLLALATSASAECALVMWMETSSSADRGVPPSWDISYSYSTPTQCETALAAKIQQIAASRAPMEPESVTKSLTNARRA